MQLRQLTFNLSKQMFKKIIFILTLCLFTVHIASAQLQPFVFNVTSTDESCTGNGTLTFEATDITPGATVTFKTYKLPNTTIPIASQTTTMLTGLVSGTYLVIATQNLSDESNTQEQSVIISNIITPLIYNVSGTNSQCSIGGTITVNVTSGNAAFYEIISGPVIRPLQTTNIFSDIPPGTYEIRVFDECGEALVKTYIVFSDSPSIQFSPATFDNTPLLSCNSINIKNAIIASNGAEITYPLTFTYTVYPPNGGTPVIIIQTITSGAFVSATIPFYNGVPYTYTITTTGACGETISHTEEINDGIAVVQSASPALCGLFYLKVFTSKFFPPYTMEFLTMPEGFIPSTFNPNYPNFSIATVKFGSEAIPVPGGVYKVKVTDACGNTAIDQITLDAPIIKPSVNIIPEPGCVSNYADVNISVPPRIIISAQIITAPSGFTLPLPADMMPFYNASTKTLALSNLIAGDYVIVIIDECGAEYVVPFTVPVITTSTIKPITRPDCNGTTGSIKITGTGSTTITSVIITEAPQLFPQQLPFNASTNINTSGSFIFNDLPPGNYTLIVLDSCGKEHTVKLNVEQQIVTQDSLDLTRFCGSFKFQYTHIANTMYSTLYYLQRLDPITNTWGHPQTSVAYPEGTDPNSSNSLLITNGTTNYNISTFGEFRIVKIYSSIGPLNGPDYVTCYVESHHFTMNENFAIQDIIKLSCDGSSLDIQVITDGIPPLTYKIIEKDGLPFLLDNGDSNIFLGLAPAIYKFQVQQSCGNIVTQIVDVAHLPESFYISQPDDIVICDDADMDSQYLFDLSLQNSSVIGTQNSSELIVSYYTSLADAQAGINPLPLQYLSSTKTIYVRLQGLEGDCYKTTSFQIIVKPYPFLAMKLEYALCNGEPVTVSADAGMSTYLWSTGETTPTITVSTPGIYTLQVTKQYGSTITCPATYTVIVKNSNAPVIENITTTDWTFSDNTITVMMQGGNNTDYLYSIDNSNFQESNIFTNLNEGSYQVFVKNIYGCGDVKKVVHLLNYPHFFTPNGDGINDTWHINFAKSEPNLKVYIFDRYGKLIKQLLSKDSGWDGTLNGRKLPSTDYWFMVQREDGQEFRGHFSMKR